MAELPMQLPWRRFVSVLRKLGYQPQKAGRGSARSFYHPARVPNTVSFREPHPAHNLGRAMVGKYVGKLLLSSDEFMTLLDDC